jgi:acylglycerol lipase
MTSTKEDWTISSTPSLKLYTKTWIPKEEIIATVIFCHGLGEHINRYHEMFEYFSENAIKTTAFDQRGFGHTVRLQGNHGVAGTTDGLETTLKDIKIISDKARISKIPHFIFGHSMGGFLALRFASENSSGLAGCIASGIILRLLI